MTRASSPGRSSIAAGGSPRRDQGSGKDIPKEFKAEPQLPPRKLLYRRGGLSHRLSHTLGHSLSHITNGSPEPAFIIPPARDGHRRSFSEADKRRIVDAARQPGASLSDVARRYGIAGWSSSPLGATTQSHATGDFLKVYERPRKTRRALKRRTYGPRTTRRCAGPPSSAQTRGSSGVGQQCRPARF
jgi:hypothetical protein